MKNIELDDEGDFDEFQEEDWTVNENHEEEQKSNWVSNWEEVAWDEEDPEDHLFLQELQKIVQNK